MEAKKCTTNMFTFSTSALSAYQLHAQTLIWPFDPYYEQMINNKVDLRRTSTDPRKRHKHLMDQMRVREESQSPWTQFLSGLQLYNKESRR